MRTFSRKELILLCYMVIFSSYFHNFVSAVSLPENVKVPAIFVFGDSIADTGNNNYILTVGKANFSPYGRDFPGGIPTGRFSNGKVPPDLIAEELGIKKLVPPYLDPNLNISDLLTGVSFASGNSGYDPLTPIATLALSLEDQVRLFKEYICKLKAEVGENRTSTIISQAVYVIFAGSNDITNTYSLVPLRKLQYDPSSYAGLMVHFASTFVKELYSLGARRIGVISAPPCGCLPSQRTLSDVLFRACSAMENQDAILFNQKLSSELQYLNKTLPGSRIVYLDVYAPLLDIIANPSNYGFEVADRGCCATGLLEASILCTGLLGTCSDASKYVFWDSFHPTEKTYKILVQKLVEKSFHDFF